RGTIYRNLNLLAQNGEILIVRVPGADRFDCRLERHYHLLCTSCGKVCDVPLPYHAELDKEISQATGFAIAWHHVICEGLCPECQKLQADAVG
ncbi:MAG: transcriptional repressor, partial [Clostridia bacterium]